MALSTASTPFPVFAEICRVSEGSMPNVTSIWAAIRSGWLAGRSICWKKEIFNESTKEDWRLYLTLFKTGIIFSPRSFALWKTDIDWAWTPWLASTSVALSWGDSLFTCEEAYKKQSSLTCRKGSRDFPSEIDMTLRELSDGHNARRNEKEITGVSIKFKRCSRPWNLCNMLKISKPSVGLLEQKNHPTDLAVWALTKEI